MRKSLILALLILYLTACAPTLITEDPTATPVSTETVAPTPTPTRPTYVFSIELPSGVIYGPPSLADAKFLKGSGGGGRDDILAQTDMTDSELQILENAAYEGALRSGYSKDNLQIIYRFDAAYLQWNMVLRLASGEYLWAQNVTDGTFSTFPLQIPYGAGGIAWNPDFKLVTVTGSRGAESMFTSGGSLVLKGGPKVTIDGITYYSQWFDTNTGQWEEIPAVTEAMTAAVDAKWKKFENGAAASDKLFLRMPVGELLSYVNWLAMQASDWIDTNAEPVEIYLSRKAYVTEMTLRLRPQSHNAELVSSLRLNGGEMPVYAYVWRILNKDKTVSILVTGVGDSPSSSIERDNFLVATIKQFAGRWESIVGCDFTLISRINTPEPHTNWYAYLLPPEVTSLIEEEWVKTQVMPGALNGKILPGYQADGKVVR